ncbi:MAG: two component sigma54 specific Fis family transcriptional regulator [Nitrospirae bacterium]|nr:MAG: two component sigma54 specific Fis family transcriptional regulator [Nitrospirota bacterium]
MTSDSLGTVLLVEDDASSLKVLAALLGEVGYGISCAEDGDQAIRLLQHAEPDAIISDIKLPGRDGLSLLDYCRRHHPDIPVILLTAYGSVQSAMDAISQGAFYYFVKPPDYVQLRNILALAVERRRLKREISRLQREKMSAGPGVQMIWEGPVMKKVRDIIDAVRNSQGSVLISGETGSGKDMIAQALHYSSTRADEPFVAVNCAAIPYSLMEAELFGHEKGAFTGAMSKRIGKFVEASGGTLFLDEVGELGIDVQAKLLRVLQDRVVQPLGSNRDVQVDFRLVCASNRDLAMAVAKGTFREDIYYRINVINIDVPPLRVRKHDIPLLASHFLREMCARENRVLTFSREVLDLFRICLWPGNVRQLKNAVERAVIIARGSQIELSDLPDEVAAGVLQLEPAQRRTLRLRDLEREAIIEALERSEGNKSEAARLLGISRKALYKKIEGYSIKAVDAGAAGGQEVQLQGAGVSDPLRCGLNS